MEHLYEYLVFLAEVVTIVVAILVILAAVSNLGARRRGGDQGHLEVRKLNDRLSDLKRAVQGAVLEQGAFRKTLKRDQKAEKRDRKARKGAGTDERRKRVFVMSFEGDLQATRVNDLSTEITAVLTLAEAGDEVLVKVESPGGLVHAYGLAASQLDRVKQHGIPLVVAVDKVAASGGYLMAAVADRVIAAPFAVVGSIGVVAQIPNVHRLLKRHDVDVEVLTAGKYKRTLTVLGENTEEGRQKFLEELNDVHALFQEFVGAHRPQLDMSRVATGETWYGQRALDLALVDQITTSDEYLAGACDDADVYSVRWVEHKKPIERLMARLETAVQRALDRVLGFGGAA